MTETTDPAAADPAGAGIAMPASQNHTRIDAAIDAWFAGHIRNSPLAQATQAYNHLVQKIGALKAAIVAAIEQEI